MEEKGQQEQIKKLEQQAREYLSQSDDPIFTQYLQQLLPRIQQQQKYVEQMQAELDKSVAYWHQRQQSQPAQMTVPEQIPQIQMPTPPSATPQTPAPVKKRNTEYVLATVALSVVGGVFILAALVLFGMYFMNGWIKGISLYAVSLVVVLLAELLIRRKLPKLAQVFSAIGVAALYLSTMINTLALHNFGIFTAAVIIALTTAATVWLSHKRDSLIHRLLGIASCWLCAYPLTMTPAFSEAEVVLVLALVCAMNVVCLCVPVQKYHTASCVTQLGSAVILFPVTIYWTISIQKMPFWVAFIAYGVFFAIGNLILILQSNYAMREGQKGRIVGGGTLLAFYIVYIVVTGLTVGTGMNTFWYEIDETLNTANNILMATALIITVLSVFMIRSPREKWLPCYFFSFVTICALSVEENNLKFVICMSIMLLAVKVLSRLAKGGLKALDAILTTVYCIMLLAYGTETPYAYILLAGTTVSIFLVWGWTTYQEIVLTFTLALFAAINLVPMLKLPAFSGILFVCILLFNNVKIMRGKHILVFNIFVMVGQAGVLLCLINPVYRNSYIIYLFLLIFGLAYLVLTFQEKYYWNVKHKELFIAVFMTYMALVFWTNTPVINSILVMLTALVSVTMGFLKKDKPVRIYGLVLSLCTCGKIALYDYLGAPILQKTILFFVVGVIALVIAGIYIVIEKKAEDSSDR